MVIAGSGPKGRHPRGGVPLPGMAPVEIDLDELMKRSELEKPKPKKSVKMVGGTLTNHCLHHPQPLHPLHLNPLPTYSLRLVTDQEHVNLCKIFNSHG